MSDYQNNENDHGDGELYRLVDVGEELGGRELNDIVESWGCRDDETAINQLCET